jgi:hypothetical protein
MSSSDRWGIVWGTVGFSFVQFSANQGAASELNSGRGANKNKYL